MNQVIDLAQAALSIEAGPVMHHASDTAQGLFKPMKSAKLDAAIADERALGQAEKDTEAMGRAIRKGNDGDIGEVSILSDAIKLAD